MTEADSVHSTPPTNTSAFPVDPTRRPLLTIATGGVVTAAIPVTVLPAAPADPIFVAIDKHKKANAAHQASIDELARLERILGDEADGSIAEKPCRDENVAFSLLVGTAATTVAGLFAKIDYLSEIAAREAWMLDEREGTALDLIESFAGSLRNIWGVQA
ncbi:hypothetical protein [Bradyrhizobium sp. AUGA SZCCT0283]|uniref:hypothetical protein n=1 Tax=Bradyrhizobium sp. AUGA SZCCT0283 TaxID=2807671 RepID=UPI001BAE14A2|nr:hypothetical protein [Bradyrhizobium sp. AUGA SZCCT0283]MBR1277736.1 hypothetical protein [Bradyrhizobium sp. AUGA SZCCT0283]